ncbi:MAG: protein translocase subunit SecD [Thermoflexales bacterium]|nr:protein translocase subunit SecD [Thermoflexales bacterium]
MSRRNNVWLIITVVLALVAGFIALTNSERLPVIERDIRVRYGLDLSGGSQVLLEATDCTGSDIATRLENARQIIEKRVNGLGVSEPLVQIQGDCRILIELPAIDNPADALALIQQTGRLEWTDNGQDFYQDGQIIRTTGNPAPNAAASVTETATLSGTLPVTATVPEKVYTTIVNGADLDPTQLTVQLGGVGNNEPQVSFVLQGASVQTFASYTANNVGSYACIVLDNVVQSCPRIQSQIPNGQGVITVGAGGVDEANRLVNLLRYGALPVALQVVQSRTIGPTLGEDSIRASLIAGIIGLLTVALFMLLHYRLPGLLAVIALLLYVMTVFAIYRLLPVTLTLPGIAGFILSVGVAVDANILIFERMKEELRAGRRLGIAIEVGFERAWPSIRDSNISTLITSGILFWFGNAFGASIVKGFALTLAIGVFVSLFTAIRVTRTLLLLVVGNRDFEERKKLFGI